MKTLISSIISVLFPFYLIAQTHSNPTGSFALVGDGFSYKFETHYINVPGEEFLRINAHVSAADYGFAQIQIFSYNHQTQYGQFAVFPNQLGLYLSDDVVYEIPNNCAIHLTVYAVGTSAISYKVIENPIEIEYTYDVAGNRIQRSIIYLYPSSKKSAKSDSQFLTDIIEKLSISQEFKVYPNPSNQHIYVALNEEVLEFHDARIIIYDMTGKQHLLKQVDGDVMQIDLSSYTNGIYILELVYGTSVKECKIIKY